MHTPESNNKLYEQRSVDAFTTSHLRPNCAQTKNGDAKIRRLT